MSTFRKVRVGSKYLYNPVPLDILNPPAGGLEKGDILKVINLLGCPRANTMGHCYVEKEDGLFGGLVCTNSLLPLKEIKRKSSSVITIIIER
jgi:hypothetical protein